MPKFTVAAVFSNHMVLQREKNITVFGQGIDGETVSVEFSGNSYETIVKDGQWSVILPPQLAGEGYEMTVYCKDEIKKYTDIAVGEVWLAGGQSNMEWELKDCIGGKEMLAEDKNPKVRFYYTPKKAYIDDDFYKAEEQSGWQLFSEKDAANWSAVGYVFGKKLAVDLDVTVGIIGCNWGGTSASNWLSEEALSEDIELNTYLEEYNRAIEGKSEEQQIAEYREYEVYAKEWDARCAVQFKKKPDTTWPELIQACGECKWPGPKGCMSPFRPSGLYNTMLKRVMPYTLRGFLFYQGESDDHKPGMYQKLLTRLIRQWREDWGDITLPFLMVQLTMHRYKADPDFKNWCIIREAQMNTYKTVKNTGIAVILDSGAFDDIHPKDKKPVGERLALQAMNQVYHKISEQEAFGPIYSGFIYQSGSIELSFDYAKDGFIIKGEAGGFEIAGENGIYFNAQVEICGSKIYVSNPDIIKPVYARYCWTNYGEVTVFGKNGIPLAPFRTHFGM